MISTLGAVSWPVTFVGRNWVAGLAVLGGLERESGAWSGSELHRSSAAGQSAIRSSYFG